MARPDELRINNTRESMTRFYQVKKFYTTFWYIFQTSNNFPDVEFRYSVIPTKPLPYPLSLDQESIQYEIGLGYNDTVQILKMQKGERNEFFNRRKEAFMSKFKN